MQATLDQKDNELFWDRIAPKYAQRPIRDQTAYEEKLSAVRKLLRPGNHLLEIGCGTGGTAIKLAPSVSKVTATDISQQMIDIAKSKVDGKQENNIAFRRADAKDLIGGQPFDVVCAFSLLHLVDDIQQVLAGVRRQLKPGGLFISKTVCLKDGSYPIRLFVRLLTAMGIAPKVTPLSRSELIRHLEFAGFEIEEVSHFGNQRTNPFIVARRYAD